VDTTIPIIAVAAGPVVIAALLTAVYLKESRARAARAEAISKEARSRGLVPGTFGDVPGALDSTVLFTEANPNAVKNIFACKTDEKDVAFFDVTFAGRLLGRVYENTISACAAWVGGGVPMLFIRGENLATKAATLAGLNDVKVGDREFDRRFHIGAPAEFVARRLLANDVRPFLIERPGINVELVAEYLLVYYAPIQTRLFYTAPLSAQRAGKLMDEASELAGLLRRAWLQGTQEG
jgi:hypothetical protein